MKVRDLLHRYESMSYPAAKRTVRLLWVLGIVSCALAWPDGTGWTIAFTVAFTAEMALCAFLLVDTLVLRHEERQP